jgi:hypothetical protein
MVPIDLGVKLDRHARGGDTGQKSRKFNITSALVYI